MLSVLQVCPAMVFHPLLSIYGYCCLSHAASPSPSHYVANVVIIEGETCALFSTQFMSKFIQVLALYCILAEIVSVHLRTRLRIPCACRADQSVARNISCALLVPAWLTWKHSGGETKEAVPGMGFQS